MNYEDSLPRSVVIDICTRLGHDPNNVSELHLTYDTVTVIYEHRITDDEQ